MAFAKIHSGSQKKNTFKLQGRQDGLISLNNGVQCLDERLPKNKSGTFLKFLRYIHRRMNLRVFESNAVTEDTNRRATDKVICRRLDVELSYLHFEDTSMGPFVVEFRRGLITINLV